MKKRIGRYLAYINRTRQYQGIIAFVVYTVLLLGNFDVHLKWYMYILLIPGIIFLSVLWGFIDTKLGIRKMEYYDIEKNQPIRMEMYEMVKRIYKDIYENTDVSGD